MNKVKTKPKTKAKVVFIKILHSSLMGNFYSGSSFDGEAGDVIRAVFVTKEMRENAVANGGRDFGPGYLTVRDRGFIAQAFATEEISDAEYRKAIRKLEDEQEEKIEEKKKIDKHLNWLSRALVSFRKQRKAVKKK